MANINLGGDTNIVVANAIAPTWDHNTEDNNFVGATAFAPAVLAINQQSVTRMLRPLPWGVGKQGSRGDGDRAWSFCNKSAICYTEEGEALAKINLGGDPNIVVANAIAPTGGPPSAGVQGSRGAGEQGIIIL